MSFVGKLKDFVGMPSDEEYEEAMEEEYSERPYINEMSKKNKVVNLNSNANNALQVVLVKPDRFENATDIADHLNEKRTVVLNLEATDKETSRRLIDFLCGVAYANGGKIQRIANATFIITPFNVDMMGEVLDEIESSGVLF